MADQTNTLKIVIQTLVQGLKEVAQLGEAISNTGKAADDLQAIPAGLGATGAAALEAEKSLGGVSEALQDAHVQAKATADALEAALGSLGGRSTASVTVEIDKIRVALDAVKNSGASFDEIGKATALAEQRIKQLEATLEPLPSEIDKAFGALGGRSTAQVTAAINEVKSALDRVRESGASFAEIERAELLAESAIKRLNSELKDPAPKSFTEGLDDIAGKLKKLDFGGALEGVKGLYGAIGNIVQLGVAGVAVKYFTDLLGSLGDKIKEVTQYAAKVETAGVTLGVVGRNAGYSATQIDVLTKSIEKQGITTEAARSSLTAMIQAGIPIASLTDEVSKAGERLTTASLLARRAQDLAVVSGENSSDTLARLTLNIQQQDSQGLKFMGLTVDREAAQARYANSLGVTASSLSLTQQKQAFLNATLESAAKLSGAYEEALDTVGKKLGSLKRFQDEFNLALGNNFVQAYGASLDAQRAFLEQGTGVIKYFNDTSTAVSDLKAAVAPIFLILSDLGTALLAISFDVFVSATPVLKQIGGAIGDVYGLIREVSIGLANLFTNSGDSGPILAQLDPIRLLLGAVALAIAAVRDGFAVFAIAGKFALGAVAGVFADLITLAAKAVGFFDKDLGASLEASAANFRKFSDGLDASAQKQVQAFEDGGSAIAGVLKQYDGIAQATRGASVATDAFSDRIAALAQLQREGKTTNADLGIGYNNLAGSLQKAKEEGKLTEAQFNQLNKQLEVVPDTFKTGFADAAAAAKTSLGQLRSGLAEATTANANFLQGVLDGAALGQRGLEAIGSTAVTIGGDILNAYEHLVDGAKSIEDFQAAADKLTAVQKSGKLTADELSVALDKTAIGYGKVFEAGLKAAQTSSDYSKLVTTVVDLGIKGQITGTQVTNSLRDIADKAGSRLNIDLVSAELERLGGSGKVSADAIAAAFEKVKSEAKQSTDETNRLGAALRTAGDAAVKVATSHLALVKAEVDVQKAQQGVTQAQNTLYGEYNQQNRLGLELAKQNLAIAQEQRTIALLRNREEVANYDLLISKQNEKNVAVALEGHLDDESLLKRQQEAKDETASQQQRSDAIGKQISDETVRLTVMQEQNVKTQGQIDLLKQITGQTDAAGVAARGAAQGYAAMGQAIAGAAQTAGSLSSSLEKYTSDLDAEVASEKKAQDALNHKTFDNSVQFTLADKYDAGKLGADDLAQAKANLTAQQANLTTYQQNSQSYSFVGAQEANAAFIKARNILDKVNEVVAAQSNAEKATARKEAATTAAAAAAEQAKTANAAAVAAQQAAIANQLKNPQIASPETIAAANLGSFDALQSVLPVSGTSQATIAGAVQPTAKAAGITPTEYYQLDLNLNGTSVSTQVQATQADQLLALLAQTKKRTA